MPDGGAPIVPNPEAHTPSSTLGKLELQKKAEARAANEAKRAANAQPAAELANTVQIASQPPAGTPEKGLLQLADNKSGLFGQPSHVIAEGSTGGLSGVLPRIEPQLGNPATPPVVEVSSQQSAEDSQTPTEPPAEPPVSGEPENTAAAGQPQPQPESTAAPVQAAPDTSGGEPSAPQPDTQLPDRPASPDMPKPPDVPPASAQPAQGSIDNGAGMAPPLDIAAEQKQVRSNYVKAELAKGIVQEDLKRALGSDYDNLMQEMLGDTTNPKEFDIDAQIDRLDKKPQQQRTRAENRLLMRLKEINGQAEIDEGQKELTELDPKAPDYQKAKEDIGKKIAEGQHMVRNADEREQMTMDKSFVDFLAKQGLDIEAIDVESEINRLGKKDKLTPEDQYIKERFEEAHVVALNGEGQKELDALRASGEDLASGVGKQKEDDALKKINQNGKAAEARENLAMRMNVLGDESLKELFRRTGYSVDDAAQMLKILEHKQGEHGLSSDEERLQRRLQELQGQIQIADGMQQLKNARNDAERFDAVKRIGQGHAQERNWLRKRLDSIGEGLAGLSGEKLKDLHRQAGGYRRGVKTFKSELREAEKRRNEAINNGASASELARLNKAVDAADKNYKSAHKLWKDARGEWRRKMALKGFLLWFFVIGPAALVAVPALLPSKLMQWGGKAGGGH